MRTASLYPQSFRFEHGAKPRLIHANLADWSNDGPMRVFAKPRRASAGDGDLLEEHPRAATDPRPGLEVRGPLAGLFNGPLGQKILRAVWNELPIWLRAGPIWEATRGVKSTVLPDTQGRRGSSYQHTVSGCSTGATSSLTTIPALSLRMTTKSSVSLASRFNS